MSQVVIRAVDLSKEYHIGAKQDNFRTLRDSLVDAFASPFIRAAKLLRGQATGAADLDERIWALDGVSFEVQRGSVVGIIGCNGAGKSTLLKILSRITEPTTGFVELQGRASSLLEVGTGFHPELTGRENIYLNGAILGMRKADIGRKFDEIVDFSGIKKFIDTPVKHYSSGMYVRLAFAVAAQLEPEILLVDEVLAVGDAAFQKKCLGKIESVAKGGRTVLFVSHSMAAIARLCERVILLEGGRLKLSGSTAEVLASYLSAGAASDWINPSDSPGGAEFRVKSARILSIDDEPAAVIQFQNALQVEILYEVKNTIVDLSVICVVADSPGGTVWSAWDTDATDWRGGYATEPGRYLSKCRIPGGVLKPGRYQISIGARSEEHKFDYHENVLTFDISQVGYHLNPGRSGLIIPPVAWERKRLDADSSNRDELMPGLLKTR